MFLEERLCWKEKPSSPHTDSLQSENVYKEKREKNEIEKKNEQIKQIKKRKKLQQEIKTSEKVIENRAKKEANEKEKQRKEIIISTTGAVVENLKEQDNTTEKKENHILNNNKPAKEEAENLEQRKIHDQKNAKINAENAIKIKNKIQNDISLLREHKNTFEKRLNDIQKIKEFPNKQNQIKNIKKSLKKIEISLTELNKKIIIKKEEVASNKEILKKGEIDIKKLQSIDTNNNLSQDSIELVGDYVFRGIGLEKLKQKIFAMRSLSLQEKQNRYEQIATASILYKIETPTAQQAIIINRNIAQRKEKGETITLKKQKTLTKRYLKKFLSPHEIQFLKQDNGKKFLRNEKIFQKNKQRYASSALKHFPQFLKRKVETKQKQEPDFLDELSQLNSEHLQYYKNISNQIEPREIKNIIHNRDGSTTMVLEKDISLTIPKNNNPENFLLDVNGEEKQISYEKKNIEKTIERTIASQTLQILGLEKYIPNSDDQLNFIQICTTNYRSKSGTIGIQRSGRAKGYKQDKKLLPFKETLLDVQQSLHKTLGIEYPTNEINKKKVIPEKGIEKLQHIGILGKDKKFNPKGMNHFKILQIFSQKKASHIAPYDFNSFKKLLREKNIYTKNIPEIKENNKLLNSSNEGIISLAIGGAEEIKFGIENGNIVAK